MKIPEDPFVRELLPEFVDTWLNDIDSQFNQLIIDKNADDLYRFAHTIKGSCLQFGLDDIAALGIQLMEFAKRADWEKAKGYDLSMKKLFLEVKDLIESGEIKI